MSGFAFSSRTMSLKKTIILSLSHSGQTFPTLHATHTLRKLCGDRVFVVTGSVDSKMSAAVGQLSYVGAPWLARTWTTFAGNYPKHAHTRTHTYTHTHVKAQTHTDTCMDVLLCVTVTSSNTFVCIYVCARACVCVCVCVCACVDSWTCACTQDGDLPRHSQCQLLPFTRP